MCLLLSFHVYGYFISTGVEWKSKAELVCFGFLRFYFGLATF